MLRAMRFRTFPKVSTKLAPSQKLLSGTWVALEKVHGAQFVVAYDRVRDRVRFGKRKNWLSESDAFFGWQLVADELAQRVRPLARSLDAPQVFAYGELFGGRYPHPDVPAVAGLQAVQTGIWYAPDLRWCLFDVLVARGDEDEEGEFLAHSELESLARAHSVLMPPVLARGRRGELDAVPVRYASRVSSVLGLPALEANDAEGYVSKPDARCAPSERAVFKRKIPEFDDARFAESESWSPGRLSFEELRAWSARLVNPARIASARSKVGVEREALLDEVALDVAVDLEQVFPEAWGALDAEQQAALETLARDLAGELVTANED